MPTMSNTSDHHSMARALALAYRGLFTTAPNPRVGCVIVRKGCIVGEGWHERTGSAHAEIHALAQAGEKARGATAYVTLEPCCHEGRTPPCTDALIRAGVRRVVVAMTDPNPRVAGEGLQQLAATGIEVYEGIALNEAEQLNPGFIMRMKHGRPFVRCKIAMSTDGRTAMASGESRWITGPAARRDVQYLRARSSVILTGSGTVSMDNPSLTVRHDDLEAHPLHTERMRGQPVRVVLDTSLNIPAQSKLLNLPGRTVIATGPTQQQPTQHFAKPGVDLIELPIANGRIDLHALMNFLAREEANEVLLEAGPTLNGAMLQAGLIDELVIYAAPVLMGSEARGLFDLPGLERMSQRVRLNIKDIRAIGEDWRITATIQPPAP